MRLFVQVRREGGGWSVHGIGLSVRHQLRVYTTRRFAIETARQWWNVRGDVALEDGYRASGKGQLHD